MLPADYGLYWCPVACQAVLAGKLVRKRLVVRSPGRQHKPGRHALTRAAAGAAGVKVASPAGNARFPVRGRSCIVASMARRRDWLMFPLRDRSLSRGFRSTMIGAVKLVTHDKRASDRCRVICRCRFPGPLRDRGKRRHGTVFMMGDRKCEASEVPGAVVTANAAQDRGLS